MVEKIIVNPLEVRGLGNIVSPKTEEDFENYMSSLTEEEGIFTLTYDGTGTHLTLSASPTTISYGGSTVFTAVLIQTGEPVEGETVSFYEGETLLGTDTTDSNGEATLTKSDFTVGSHSVKAVYDEVESGTVSVTVNKLASTITLSVPASGTVGTSYTVSGTLVPTSGSVKLYENGSLKDTLTVSSGTFSKVITQSNEGTYSYYAVFEGSSTYSSVTSSTGSIVVSDVPTPVPDSIDLTGTKSILSYADSESCTLTATVLDSSDNPVQGVDVNLYNGSTLWDTLTTDSSGEVSKTYSSAGSGDITFTAEVDGTLLTKTYEVEDCIKVGFNNWNGTFTTGTDTYDYIQITGTGVGPNITLPSNWEMSYKLKNTRTADYADGSGLWVIGTDTNNGVLIGHEGTDRRIRVYSRSGGSNTVRATEYNVYSYQTWTDATITYNEGTISLTVGGKTVSYSLSSSSIMQFYTSYAYLRIAEWKIKPL